MRIAECPLCSLPVANPEGRPNAPLRCSKCHTSFHLDRAGKVVLGRPPEVGDEVERKLVELKQALDPRLVASKLPTKRAVPVVASLLVLGLAWYVVLGPSAPLEQAAERAARAFAADDRSTLRGLATSDTAEDLDRWADSLYPGFDRERSRWPAKEVIQVEAAKEDAATGKGTADVLIRPGVASGLDVSLANPEAATASAPTTLLLRMAWVRNWRGRWRLDGKATLARSSGGF